MGFYDDMGYHEMICENLFYLSKCGI